MTNWKSMFFRLVELARPEKTVNDEAEIIGWATHEDGQHYPIHAAQGGGGGSSASGGSGKNGGSSGGGNSSSKSSVEKSATKLSNEDKANRLVSWGGKRWQKGDNDRIYLRGEAGRTLADLEVEKWGSGGYISKATLNGEEIRSNEAMRIKNYLDEAYYNVKTGKIENNYNVDDKGKKVEEMLNRKLEELQ